MNSSSRSLHIALVLLTSFVVIAVSLLAVGQVLQSNWNDLFLFNGDSLTLALYAKSLFSGELRDWTFSSQIFFFPEIFIYVICYALTPNLEWSFILNGLVNYWLYIFILYRIASAVGADLWVRCGFAVLTSCLLLLYCSLEQGAEVNVTALVTLFLFNTYYFGAVLCALCVTWICCGVLNGNQFAQRYGYGLILALSAMTYFSNPMFLLQGAVPFVACVVVIRWHLQIDKRIYLGLVVSMIIGVLTGQVMRMIFSDHIGKSIGKYVHLRSVIDGIQGFGANLARVANSTPGVVEYSIITGLLLTSLAVAAHRLGTRQRARNFSVTPASQALLFLILFSAFSASITLVGTLVSGNYLMRYFLPVALLPVFVLLTIFQHAQQCIGATVRLYFGLCAIAGIGMVVIVIGRSNTAVNFSWLHDARYSQHHEGIRCFNGHMSDKPFNVVGTFWSTRTLDAYRTTRARALQVNERFEPTLWLNNRATYKELAINGLIVSRPQGNVRQKGNIYAEDTRILGIPDRILPCKDFDIYFYADGSPGFTQLAEQMKKLKR
jgi:hypothetical protein